MPMIQTGDIETYFEQTGSGEPLLFIHGLGATAASWAFQVPVFAAGYRVITYDLRGHGRSGHPPGPYAIARFAADTRALLTALDASPAHVVGLSLGGAIALQLALADAACVRTLTVVNSGPGLELRTVGDRLRWTMFVTSRRVMGAVLNQRQLGRLLARRLFPRPEQAALRAEVEQQLARNDPSTYRAAAEALLAWNIVDRLGEIRCPTLVVSADHDYTPVRLKAAYVARMPNAVLEVIHNSRHATPLDQPAQFNAVVEAFLAQHVGTKASAGSRATPAE
jgi:pimeloyl-ACP methyl ester carboxylesterase